MRSRLPTAALLAALAACQPTQRQDIQPGVSDPDLDQTQTESESERETPSETESEDETETASDTGLDLNGERIAAIAPPDFDLVNQHGETRTPDWLLGHPTVLWFFREASGSS